MSAVSDIRVEQRHLKVGDKVVVYVPWQARDEHGVSVIGTYWEGRLMVANGSNWYVLRARGRHGDTSLFDRRFIFPERLRGRVRYVGKIHRLRIDS